MAPCGGTVTEHSAVAEGRGYAVPQRPTPEMRRDPAFESALLAEVAELCERQHGIRAVHYGRDVQARMAYGEERFGNTFLDRDNLAEALEESPDAGVYGLLELQRLKSRLREQEWMELRMEVIGALVDLAAAHERIRHVRHKVAELNHLPQRRPH